MKIERFKYGSIVRELTNAQDATLEAMRIHYENVDGGTQPAADLIAEKSIISGALARAEDATKALAGRLVELERRIRTDAPQASPARRPARAPARRAGKARK